MNDGLKECIEHNSWATDQLLSVCGKLNDAELEASVPGVYGNIRETLWHIVASEASYCARLTGFEPNWDRRSQSIPAVSDLIRYNNDLAERWQAFLSAPFDGGRTIEVQWDDGSIRDIPTSIILGQCIHHGNEHRAQVASELTALGIEPPGWGLWEFAEVTGKAQVKAE